MAPLVAACLVAGGPGLAPISLAALAAAVLVVRLRPAATSFGALLVALPAFGHEPVWAAVSLCGIAAGAGLQVRVVAGAARGALAFLACGTLLAIAPPWMRAQPVATLLGAVTRPPARLLDQPLAHKGVPLSAESPLRGWSLSGAPAGGLVVESSLADSTGLDCGRVVATVRLLVPGRSWVVGELTVGPETGEWASARPDVAQSLACDALVPHVHWLPDAGRFFGRTFSARMAVDPAVAAERVEIERSPDLPPGVRLYVQRVATVR